MKGYKIVLAWLITVIIGSLGLPVWAGIIDDIGFRATDTSEILLMGFLCMLVSGVLSAPTLVVLLLRNFLLKRKKLPIRKHFRKINVSHIVMALVTLFVMEAYIFMINLETYRLIDENSYVIRPDFMQMVLTPMIWVALLIVWYMLCAVPAWLLLFRKEYREARIDPESEDSTVLDSPN